MAELIINAVIVAGVTVSFNIFFYIFAIRDLKRSIELLKEKEIQNIEHDLKHAATKRGRIYTKMETLLMPRSECKLVQDNMSDRFGAIERQIRAISVQISEVMNQSTATAATVDVIRNELKKSNGN